MQSENAHTAEKPGQEQSFGDIYANLSDEDLTRGAPIANVESRSLHLCRDFIGGSWTAARGPEDLEVKRIAGGFTNQLYKVSLRDAVPAVTNSVYPDGLEPRTVAIKYYQTKNLINYSANESERLNDIIILTILSEVGIGPKIYGIFADGFIQEYCEHEQFRKKHHEQPELVRTVISHLVRVNYLNVPVRKQNNWIIEEMKSALDQAYANPEVPALIKELKLELLGSKDLRKELTEFKQFMEEFHAPTVFCHNDFRGNNILVSTNDPKSIRLVDLEYSSYGNRGFDLATIILEWNLEKPNFQDLSLPSDELIDKLVGIYIEECNKQMPGYADKPENSPLAIRNEVKFSVLVHFMFFSCYMIRQNESFIDAIPFDRRMNLKYVEGSFKTYLVTKEQLIKDGIIKANKK